MNLPPSADWIAIVTGVIVLTCWMFFAVILVIGKSGAARGAAKRDVTSTLGLALQLGAFALCLAYFRDDFSPFLPMSKRAEAILAIFLVLLALGSTWFCYAAARALGKQWALVARVIEGHELIMRGPFAVVRNPVYLALFGMLIAIGVAVSRWPALLGAVAIYLVGTWIRIRSEQKLLRETFGAVFDEYARRVPAFFPRLLR